MTEPIKIKEYIEKITGIEDLSTKIRTRHIAETRFVAFKLTKEMFPNLGLQGIGNIYNKNHATVINGIKQFDILENLADFKHSKQVYNKTLNYCLSLCKETSFIDLREKNDLTNLKDYYEKIIKDKDDKINRLTENPLIEKISNLSIEKLNNLNIRVDAFLQMN